MGFGLILTLLLLAVVIALNRIGDMDAAVVPTFLLGLQFLVWLAFLYAQVDTLSYIQVTEQSIALTKEQIDTTLPRVLAELDKYPEYEKTVLSMYGGKSGAIILPPKLAANTTVVKAVDEINSASNKVYDLKRKLVRYRVNAQMRRKYAAQFVPYIPGGK